MRYYDFPIVEYTNPCFPDKPCYKCYIGNEGFHSDDLDKVKAWRKEMVDTTDYRAQAKVATDTAMASFMADVKIKD